MRNRAAIIVAVAIAGLVTVPYLWGRVDLGPHTSAVAAPTGQPKVATRANSTAPPPPAMPALPAPLLNAAPVSVSTPGFWSWSLIDRRTGESAGSPNHAAVNGTASMIKAWLAADYLRRAAERGTTPNATTMRQLSVMIRDSDNAAASMFWRVLGAAASIRRLIGICGLTDSRPYIDWAHALLSARDSARMAVCIADGRAAGPTWTGWVLGEMRAVRGGGRFGIITALPPEHAAQTAIKNGWIARRDGKWHVNCMAVAPEWALAVMTVYPAAKGMGHGAAICKSVTLQLMARPA